MPGYTKQIAAILFLACAALPSQSQILISLLFGDKLNSDKIEFGMQGGLNQSYLNDLPEANGLNHFNLGFYFHILVKNNSFLSTGLMVKSSMGASDMPVYSLNDASFDDLYENGNLTKKINYFYLPMLFQQRFNNRWYIEAGPMVGLRSKAFDIFKTDLEGGDLEYTLNVSDQYTRLDFGMMGGVGYKLRQQLKSAAIGVSYYQGLVNVSNVPNTTLKNSSVYFYVKIPIGTAPKE